MNPREQRFVPVTRLEVRAEGEDGPAGIAGTAALYNTRTEIAGMFEEEIAPGAFDDALESSDVRGLFNHDPNFPLGRTSAGTMELRSADDGLHYEIPDLPKARADVLEAIERGDVTGNSFSFTVAEETWVEPEGRDDEGDLPLRIVQRVGELFDVGPVTFPAYEETQVSARAESRAKEITTQGSEPDVDHDAERDRTLDLQKRRV